MATFGPRYPDTERNWITLSGEFICVAVAMSDPEFAKGDRLRQDAARLAEAKARICHARVELAKHGAPQEEGA